MIRMKAMFLTECSMTDYNEEEPHGKGCRHSGTTQGKARKDWTLNSKGLREALDWIHHVGNIVVNVMEVVDYAA